MPSLSIAVDTPKPRAFPSKLRKLTGSETPIVRSETSTFGNDHVRCPIQGWPTAINPRVAWAGAEFRFEEQYTYVLSKAEIREIEAALKSFKCLGLDGQSIDRDSFPLPTLSGRIRALTQELHFGKGFFALRGLNPEHYSREDNTLLFLGVSAYVGEKRGKQDDKGHIFAHIREATYMQEGQAERPIRDSNVASAFHTDLFCDILAMQTRTRAVKGGNHIIASTAKIYEDLLQLRPDLIPVLAAANWPFDTRGKMTPSNIRPLLYYHDNRIMMNFVRDPLIGLSWITRTPDLPRLTPVQVEALDVVQVIAETNHLALNMQPGDLTFVNNFGCLHAREAFEDSDTQSRYLVRMWLKNAELAWSLPEELAAGNTRVFDNEEIDEDWNIVYKPRLLFQVAERMTP